MSIFDTVFKKQIDKAVQTIIQKSTYFTSAGSTQYKQSKYIDAKENSKIYSDAYKDELYIYGCVYLISNTIAHLPLLIYKDDTKQDIIENHPLYDLLKNPNFKDSQYDLMESVSANLELTGNTYILKDDIALNKPRSIFSLISSNMRIERNIEMKYKTSISDMIKYYEYGQVKYSPDIIIHERKYNPTDDILGMSPIQAAALTLDMTIEAKRQNYNIFKQGMSSDGVISTDQPFSEITYKRLKQDIGSRYSGQQNAHAPMVLFNGLKYTPIGINPKDMDFINGLKMNREELCGFLYQVPLILLGVLENSSYNNIKEAMRIFYNISILPRLIKNREIYQKLLDLWNPEYYIDFDLSEVGALKEDLKEKIEQAERMWKMGVPYNKIAEALDLPVRDIPGGNTGYLPFNLAPAGSPAPEKTPAKPPEKQVNKTHKIKWTPELKKQKAKQFDSSTRKIETKYRSQLVPYFKAQEQEVLNNLDKFKSITYKKLADNTFMVFGDIDGKAKPIRIESVLFDENEQVKKLTKVNLPIHTEALKEQGQAEMDLLGIEQTFNVSNPEVQRYLKSNALSKAKTVVETAKGDLKKTMITGVNEGEGIPEIKKRLQTVYKDYTDIEGYKLKRIAQTEVVGASNQGALESYKQIGGIKKGWLPAYINTRDSHIQAGMDYSEDNAIDVKDDFDLEGGSGGAPGNIGVAEEDINCRCSVIPVVEE